MAGGGQVHLDQGPHLTRIEYLAGPYPDFVRVDYVDLVLDENPTTPCSWSRVKELYR